MIRKTVAIVCLLFSIISCNNNGIDKPKDLIQKDKMIDILYDISLFESINAQNINGGIKNNLVTDYIYKKYKIDSIQLVESNKYYASDIEEYKKMFEIVKARLANETLKIDGKPKTNGKINETNSDIPQVQ